MPSSRLRSVFRPSLTLVLLGAVLVTLWVAGGASRADALGQAVVRGVSWAALVVAILFGSRRAFAEAWQGGELKPVFAILSLALALPLAQLIPLPPGVWQALPGREMFAEAALLSGQPQPWRPWSIVPDATLNAAASLIVPFVVLLLVSALSEDERRYLPGMLLAFVVASMVVGMIQSSVGSVDNIFINETRTTVSGVFANRNHFALTLAIGCVLAPVWAVAARRQDNRSSIWRMTLAAGLVVVFLVMILVSGSRAGFALGVAGTLLGLAICSRAIRRAVAPYPRWVFPAVITAALTTIALCVTVSVLAGRAQSIERIVGLDRGQEVRVQALPVVLDMVRDYFPMGAGLGAFNPIFRIHEPVALLKPSYFNNAHNDLLELVLLGGVPALLIMFAAAVWWAWRSLYAWRGRAVLPKSGSAILLFVALASVFDYPARTPAIMAFIVIGSMWLAGAGPARASSLPERRPHL